MKNPYSSPKYTQLKTCRNLGTRAALVISVIPYVVSFPLYLWIMKVGLSVLVDQSLPPNIQRADGRIIFILVQLSLSVISMFMAVSFVIWGNQRSFLAVTFLIVFGALSVPSVFMLAVFAFTLAINWM